MDTSKELPHNTEAEQSVLGAIMRDQSLLPAARAALTESDFFEHYHRAIWSAMTDLADAGGEYDAVSVGDKVDQQIAQYAVGITAETHTTAHLQSHIDIIRRAAAKRRQIDIGRELMSRGYNCAEPEDIAAYGISELIEITRQFDGADDQPLDVFGDEDLPELKPEWLPPGIAEFAIDQGKIIGVAPELIAVNCLGAIGAALHDDFVISPRKNDPKWKERGCLWVMTIARPGSKKSAGLERAIGPLRRISSLLSAKYAAEMAAFIPREKEFALRQKDQIKRRAKGDGYEEDVVCPEKPINHRIIVNDATTEKLAELFMDNARGLAYVNDELAQWFGTFDAYRSGGGATKDRPLAIRAHSGGEEYVDRVGRGSIVVPNWSYSVMGTTQPEKIREIAKGSSDDGLIQRFMVIEAAKGDWTPDYTRVENAKLSEEYEQCINTVYRLNPNGQTIIPMSDEAHAEFEKFDEWVLRMGRNEALSSMLVGHLSKYSGMWPRLALVYHVWGCARHGKYPTSLPVTKTTACRVTAFLKQFLLPQSLRFYNNTIGEASPVQNLVRMGAAMILGDGLTTISLRDLSRGTSAWRNATDWQRKAAIGMLRDSGWLRAGSGDTWIVSPGVHIQYAQRAMKENTRRRDSASLMKELRESARGG